MAKLHIIYDPSERLEIEGPATKALKLKTASLSIANDIGHEEAKELIETLTTMLVNQL